MTPELEFALEMADAADTVTMTRFRAIDLAVETKPDRTPVTEADRAAEVMLRKMITERFPEDGIVGEEYDDVNPHASRQWVLDPIDGTKNYLRGVPVWATLIALLVDGVPQLGVVRAPALGRTWWGQLGHGAFTRDFDGSERTLKVSGISNLEDASFSFSDPIGWERFGPRSFESLWKATGRVRGYGDFWSHMMVAEGVVDISAEPELSPWDQAALTPIVREAGGTVTGLDGLDAFESKSTLCTNGLLHRQVLDLIEGS